MNYETNISERTLSKIHDNVYKHPTKYHPSHTNIPEMIEEPTAKHHIPITQEIKVAFLYVRTPSNPC